MFPTGPTFAETRAVIVDALSRFAAAIAARCPPWWVWAALTASFFVAGWLLRRSSLRALHVEVPTDAERVRAAVAGRAIAAHGPIGLVLGGGGAKGAYQVGCWKALRECGIVRFGAIAGTSVGALNAVLVAQDDFKRAERIWSAMSFGRVLRMRWHLPLAIAIRLVLIVPYLGKFAFPARAIPVGLYRAVRQWRQAWRDADPQRALQAVRGFYMALVTRPQWADLTFQLTTAAIVLAGLSAWWLVAAPLFEIAATIVVAPFAVLLLVSYASWLATGLDLLATRLVLASNDPLAELIRDCVDPARLEAYPQPVFVTLGTLCEVTRTECPRPSARSAATAVQSASVRPLTQPDKDFGTSLDEVSLPAVRSAIEYAPRHFDVRAEPADRMRELILQSAGLPEIFPARQFDGVVYVDGGIADNEPLAALSGVPGHRTVIVMPLNMQGSEATIRADLSRVLERLGRPSPAALPELVVLTPSRPLGNMLTGTMDFAAERARAMIQLGYHDTIVRLARRAPPGG